jgi:8-oxo-dGTP pyrophosphatase MutT (NUDIX family)
MIDRPSARLILLDPQDRLFLFNVHDPKVFDPAKPFFDPFWVMIGGMVDPGEDYAEAAVREAGEETGLPVIDTPRWVWTRERRMSWRGKDGTELDARPSLVERRRDRRLLRTLRAVRPRHAPAHAAARRPARGTAHAFLIPAPSPSGRFVRSATAKPAPGHTSNIDFRSLVGIVSRIHVKSPAFVARAPLMKAASARRDKAPPS